ncbi:MAG TPA: transglutaminase domain-containing protein [Thermoanaerobaculia bacterium]|nr:transglutaminase domain-containing protein [Thermoanaerobaculia bacterium]
MRSALISVSAFLLGVSLFAADSRSVDATYTATLTSIPAGTKTLRVWIPLPASTRYQEVSDVAVDSPYTFEQKTEPHFHNRYLFGTIENPPVELAVKVRFKATRHADLYTQDSFEKATPAELKLSLVANHLVTLSPRVRKLADEVTKGSQGPVTQSRAIYDHLLQTMKYDKTEPGWGNGDTERACDIRKGNCTDFHSLFMSLARARGIPARFIIGFPMSSRPSGQAKGYHCWAEFYVNGKGWVPLDASDASKSTDPKIRDFLFGNLDADRIQFTMGRDLELTPATKEPLNFFIYPYGEADGASVGTPSVMLDYAGSTSPRPEKSAR